MTSGVYVQQLSVWVGTGIVTAGVSAAILAAAGTATADTSTGSKSGGVSSSGSTNSDAAKPDSTSPKKAAHSTGATAPSDADADKPGAAADTKVDTKKDDAKKDDAKKDDAKKDDAKKDDKSTSDSTDPDDDATLTSPVKPTAEAPKKKTGTAEPAAQKPQATAMVNAAKEPIESEETVTAAANPAVESTVERIANPPATQSVSVKPASPMSLAQATVAADATPAAPSLLDVVGSVISAVVVKVGSIVLAALQAVEAWVAGPPVLPPGSTVTVRNSWITLSNGQRVAANWYYPEVDEGDPPPTRMILLSHGLLALGPMYSYTAANLAEETQSIVVTPSLPSNIFAGGTNWLGSTEMAAAIAALFEDDRAALTRSALDAGYATQYGLDPATAKLPQKFGLAGHSLGGNLVPAVAGFLAESGAADDLVGVITLDGVPTGATMVDALRKLHDYEVLTDHYIPIREIGAPPNLFNSTSNINEALTAARPDRFNGVVLTGGVHMDSMRGGNPLIQFAAYVVAGFPQPQNPPAVDALMAQWFDEWFDGHTGVGDDLVPGSTIDIPTPQGTAHGVVIGTPPAAATALLGPVMFESAAPTTVPSCTRHWPVSSDEVAVSPPIGPASLGNPGFSSC
ncbi:MAG TPA: hypothetical protein VMS92_13020 [Mycobacterium sp.]|nr:hypothetical protein [Mycobacterium sp.]